MKHLLIVLALCLATYAQAATFPHFAPCNPTATPEAAALLERLYTSVDSGYIISGLHHNQLQPERYRADLDRIEAAVPGAVPMVWGGDVAWDAQKVVDMAIDHHRRGFLISITWHAARPFDRGHVSFRHQTQGPFSTEQWKELVTEGSEMHTMWLQQVDSIAQYLKQLQDANVPVLWRPFHEMNGDWFWWCDRREGHDGLAEQQGFTTIWKMLYDRLTNYHHLNNLIWVWNPNNTRKHPEDNAMGYHLYYPGHTYVDVLAGDVYHREWFQDTHDLLLELGEGRLLALGEVGELPTPDQLAGYRHYAWFMIWTTFTEPRYNTHDQLRAIFSLPQVRNL